MDFTEIVLTRTERCPKNNLAKGTTATLTSRNPSNMARREIERAHSIHWCMVACGSNSVRPWRAWATHSQPALLVFAHSTAGATCCEIVRATSRRITSPATTPRTLPSGLDINLPKVMLAGICLCQRADDAEVATEQVLVQQRRTAKVGQWKLHCLLIILKRIEDGW